MLEQKIYTADEINKIISYAYTSGNSQGAIEARHHFKFFGKEVKIIKGRNNVDFIGNVFWLARKHYGTNSWFGFQTKVGIRDKDKNVVWTSVYNIKIEN